MSTMTGNISNNADKILASLAVAYKMGLESKGDGFKDTEQANNILRIAEKTCKVEGNVFDERIIQFQSATLNELEKEQIVWMANHKGQQPNPKQSQRYMNFVSQLEALAGNNTGADEFVTASEENVKIDPISKKPIKVPVLNRRCNHIYDKESILKAIQVNNKLRCPYVGCMIKRVVVADLIIPQAQGANILDNEMQIDLDE